MLFRSHPAFAGGGSTPPDVSSADDDGELERGRDDFLDLLGEVTRDAGRKMVARLAECFPGKFEQQTSARLSSKAPSLRRFRAQERRRRSGGKL